MTCRLSHTSIDARDAYAQSVCWGALLGMSEDPDDPNEPGHEECLIRSRGGGTEILFIEVPEDKSVKNRLHFDLRPTDGTRDDEVDRLLGAGATLVADLRQPGGGGWVTLADPEGNEFCVLRSDAELGQPSGP